MARAKPEIFGATSEGDEKAQLIAALGHDIRGPLQVLGLSLQNLRLRAQNAETQEVVQAAESAFEEVAAIADDLIDSLRFGVGTEPPREEGFILSNLLVETERRFRRRALSENIQLRVPASRIRCVADRRCVQRILDNLVANAIKHAKATRVLVGARLRGFETLVLEVVDDGRGIPEDEQPFVFEEWYRCRGAIAEGARGQGLGLWIVRRFASAAGGQVRVRSVVGRGTRFTVEIPTYAERRTPPVMHLDESICDLRNRLVAILDDDEDVLRATRLSLEALGANVFASSDDLHFLAHVTSMPTMPALFLLDFNLGMFTVERTLRILRARYGADLRVIIVSGYTSDPKLVELGNDIPVVSKPLSISAMRMVARVLSGDKSVLTSATESQNGLPIRPARR